MTNCINCNAQVNENFCPNCGQPAKLRRIDKHYISHEILHILHFEKGFFYSAKELCIRPGTSIREFIHSNRTKHMKPVAFLVLTSLLYTLFDHLFHTNEFFNEDLMLLSEKTSIGPIWQWLQTHYGYGNLIMGSFIALSVKLLFRKYQYNIFEITVLLCFVMGQGMLLLTVETFFAGILNEQLHRIIIAVIQIAYLTWAIGQFFDRKKIFSYAKAFFAYLLGYILFYMATIFVGLITDLVIKIAGTP